MKLAKAVQIATEAISLQRQKIAFDANMLKTYHVDNIKTRACTELYQRYSDAINLLNSLVIDVPADQPLLVAMETETAAADDHLVTTPAAGAGANPMVPGSAPGADQPVTNPPTTEAYSPSFVLGLRSFMKGDSK